MPFNSRPDLFDAVSSTRCFTCRDRLFQQSVLLFTGHHGGGDLVDSRSIYDYLAALQDIPTELYEAAAIDGAAG